MWVRVLRGMVGTVVMVSDRRKSGPGWEHLPEEEIISLLKNANAGMLFGKKSVELGLKLGIIDEKGIKEVNGEPQAMFVYMDL